MTPPRDIRHLYCMACGKQVSTAFDPEPTDTPDQGLIVRAWIECPECLEAKITATGTEPVPPSVLDTTIEEVGWSMRVWHCLERATPPITTLGDLVQCAPHDLLRLKNFGRGSLREVEKELATRGLQLRQGPRFREEKEPPICTTTSTSPRSPRAR